MRKKLLASLLCLCMLVSLLPIAAFATEPTPAEPVIKAPLGDTAETYTPEQLNIADYTVTAKQDANSTAADVTAVYDVTVKHPALLKHSNAQNPAVKGLWVGIGAKITEKGSSTSGTAGQNGTGSSYYAAVSDKTFAEFVEMFKKLDWAGENPGFSEYGWRQNNGTYVFQWYNLADTTKYEGKTPYLVERSPKAGGGGYTYNVYRLNFDVTEGHLVKFETPAGGALSVKASGKTVATNTPVGEGSNLAITATPGPHYQLKSISANGIELSATNGVYNVKMGTTDVTISATFEEIKHTVTFNANGGKIDTETTKTVQVVDGNAVSAPTPTNDNANKVFMGWGTSADATETVDLTNAAVTADVTYYAVWKDRATSGISTGFSWTAAEANAARNAAARVAGKAEGLNDALDQTVWFMVNEAVKSNHYWYEITDGTNVIWKGAMNYNAESTARGMISASFLHTNPTDTENIQNPDGKQVPAQLVINVWKTDNAVTAKPDGDPTHTQTITTGTNPLKIAAATPNVAANTAKVTFNQDLFGRYVIELKKGNEVVKVATTECEAPESAVAKGTGYTFNDVSFAPGTYTFNVYQAAAKTDNTYVGSAIDSKSFEVKAETITEISTSVDGLSVAISGTEIVLTGNMKDANKTVSLSYKTSMGTEDSVDATYTAGSDPTKGTWALGSLNLFGGTTYTLTTKVNFLADKVDIAAVPPAVSASEEIQEKLPNDYSLEGAVTADAGDVLSHSTVEALLPDSASAASNLLGTNGANVNSATIPAGKTASQFTEVHVVSYFDVAVVDYSDAKAAEGSNPAEPATITLNITPMVKRVPAIPAAGPTDAVYAEFTDPNATKATKVTNYEASEPITITVTLPTGFVNATTKDNLIAKHYADEARTTVKEWLATRVTESLGIYSASFDATSFSPYELTVDDRTAEVEYAAGEDATMPTDPAPLTEFGPSDIGYTLPVPTKDKATFDGWTMAGSSTKYKVLTEELFNALIEAGGTVTLTANFSTGTSTGGGGGVSSNVTIDRPTNGKVTVTPTAPSKGATVTINLTPDTGYQVGTVTVTDKDGKAVELTKVDDTHYTFVMPDGKVTVKATFTATATTPDGFTDVPADAYYADAVKWAVDKGITNGLTATTFGPNNSCTRGQMVTFLWRAAGSPAATGTNSFTDVASGEYYYNAVLWAVEKGITNGTTATTFSPNATVNRGQTVTFLYRYAESPAATGTSSFTDVAADAYYADAVKWAVAEGITNGTSDTTFAPASNCTRGQIVTFLYRQMAE